MPNIMTAMRLAMVPAFYLAYSRPDVMPGGRWFALLIFLAASATDAMDGYIARKYHAVTVFGKLADPVADKLLVFTALYCLYRTGMLPLWYLLLTGVKELLLISGGAVMLRRGIVTHSNAAGKAATILMVAGIALSIPGTDAGMYILYAGLPANILALAIYAIMAIKPVERPT